MPVRVSPSPDALSMPRASPQSAQKQTLSQLTHRKNSHNRSHSASNPSITIGGVAVNSIAGRPVSSLAALAAARAVPMNNQSHSQTPSQRQRSVSHPVRPDSQQVTHSQRLSRNPTLTMSPPTVKDIKHNPPPSLQKLSREKALAAASAASTAVRKLQASSIICSSTQKLKQELSSRHGASLFKLLLLDSVLSSASLVADGFQRRKSIGTVEKTEPMPLPSEKNKEESFVKVSFSQDGSIVGSVKKTSVSAPLEIGIGAIDLRAKIPEKKVKSHKRRSSREIQFARSNLGLQLEKIIIRVGNVKMQMMKKRDDSFNEEVSETSRRKSEPFLTKEKALEMRQPIAVADMKINNEVLMSTSLAARRPRRMSSWSTFCCTF